MSDAVAEAVMVPLGTLLERVGRELAALHGLSRDAEAVLSEMASGTLVGPELCRRAQSLDALTQGLAGLADVLSRLAPTLPRSWSLDVSAALAEIPLADMQRRLLGQPPEVAGEGDAEVF